MFVEPMLSWYPRQVIAPPQLFSVLVKVASIIVDSQLWGPNCEKFNCAMALRGVRRGWRDVVRTLIPVSHEGEAEPLQQHSLYPQKVRTNWCGASA
jgi:hypothetical protein